jgi:hypothetical protein
MTDVAISHVSSEVVIGEETITPAGAAAGPGMHSMEVSRLKDLLRPIIVELLGEELARTRRMRG